MHLEYLLMHIFAKIRI